MALDVVPRQPFCFVKVKALIKKLKTLEWEVNVFWQGVLAVEDLFLQVLKSALIVTEDVLASYKLEIESSDGPHITLVPVLLILDNFRRHQEGSSTLAFGRSRWLQNLRIAKVSYFDNKLFLSQVYLSSVNLLQTLAVRKVNE